MYGIRTLSEQVPGRGPLDHPAGVHDQHFLGVGGSQGEVMADHHQRRAELLLQAEQQVHDLRLRGDVEGGRGLVGDQQPRLAGQRDRDDNALAHAARQLVRVLVEAPFRGGEAHHPQQIDGSLVRLARPSGRWHRIASVIWLPIRIVGFRDRSGSWKTIAAFLPRWSRRSFSLRPTSSTPLNRIEPDT